MNSTFSMSWIETSKLSSDLLSGGYGYAELPPWPGFELSDSEAYFQSLQLHCSPKIHLKYMDPSPEAKYMDPSSEA